MELTFRVSEKAEDREKMEKIKEGIDTSLSYVYPDMTKTLGTFKLEIKQGTFKPSEIVMMLGQNGTGKTTLIKMLAGIIKPDDEEADMP